jgi:hypothetical protein
MSTGNRTSSESVLEPGQQELNGKALELQQALIDGGIEDAMYNGENQIMYNHGLTCAKLEVFDITETGSGEVAEVEVDAPGVSPSELKSRVDGALYDAGEEEKYRINIPQN